MEKKIFISHAKKDKKLADELIDLLVTGIEVKSESIFCSSVEGLGIDKGKNFVEFIKNKLESPALVILLLSPNYFDSIFCICELGASWALSLTIKPFIIPPLKYDDMKAVLTGVECGNISEASDLSDLRDDIRKILDVPELPTARWETKKDIFLKKLPDILKEIGMPDRVARDDYNKLEARYQESLEEIKNKDAEIKKRTETIEKLKSLKDREEAEKIILDSLSAWDKLQILSKDLKKITASLPRIVFEALYYYASNTGFVPQDYDLDKVKEAAEYDYFEPFDPETDSIIELNMTDPTIKKAVKIIDKLNNLIENASPEFVEAFTSKTNYKPKMSSRKFWNDFLK